MIDDHYLSVQDVNGDVSEGPSLNSFVGLVIQKDQKDEVLWIKVVDGVVISCEHERRHFRINRFKFEDFFIVESHIL